MSRYKGASHGCRVLAICCLVRMLAGFSVMVGVLVSAGVEAQAPEAAVPGASPSAPTEYRSVIAEAVTEQSRGNFAEARALLLHAHELQPSARTLRGLGVVDFELKNYSSCIARLQAAVASRERPLTAAIRAESENLLARALRFVGYFSVHTTPKVHGIQVKVDDATVALVDGGQVMLSIGRHVLNVQAQGYQEQNRTVKVQGGERLALNFTLQPIQSAPAAALEADPVPNESSLLGNPWLWTGVGAVLLGGVITAVALSSDGEAALERGDVGGVLMTLGAGR